MKRWHKRLLIVLGILGLLSILSAAALKGFASVHGVNKVPVPPCSLIATTLDSSNYADAYKVKISSDHHFDIEAVNQVIGNQGWELVKLTNDEILYTGTAPGLTFFASYFLQWESAGTSLTLSTTVHYQNRTGRFYFTIVQVGHRLLVPALVGWIKNSFNELQDSNTFNNK